MKNIKLKFTETTESGHDNTILNALFKYNNQLPYFNINTGQTFVDEPSDTQFILKYTGRSRIDDGLMFECFPNTFVENIPIQHQFIKMKNLYIRTNGVEFIDVTIISIEPLIDVLPYYSAQLLKTTTPNN